MFVIFLFLFLCRKSKFGLCCEMQLNIMCTETVQPSCSIILMAPTLTIHLRTNQCFFMDDSAAVPPWDVAVSAPCSGCQCIRLLLASWVYWSERWMWSFGVVWTYDLTAEEINKPDHLWHSDTLTNVEQAITRLHGDAAVTFIRSNTKWWRKMFIFLWKRCSSDWIHKLYFPLWCFEPQKQNLVLWDGAGMFCILSWWL